MATPHEQAVKLALRTNKKLKQLFAKFGTSEHPNGKILIAYRQARRALRGNLDDPAAVLETLTVVQDQVRQAGDEVLRQAVELGADKAQRELEIYGQPAGVSTVSHDVALGAWLALVGGSLAAIRALALNGGVDENAVLGDSNRVGMLTPAPVIAEGVRWIVVLMHTSYNDVASSAVDEFLRQAVAAVDERTTNCCLKVHGQTTTIDGKFKLTGTPRFADEMADPPFHRYCRTVTVLVPPEYADDDLTKKMKESARRELKAEKEGTRDEVHPASAVTKR
jgi:hypothetical protein